MRQFTKTVVTFGVLIVVIGSLYMFTHWFSRTTGYVLGEDEKISLAHCLAINDAVFFTSNTCPECQKQLDLFGKVATSALPLIQCERVEQCPEGGVPAWKISGQIKYGFKNFNELKLLSGCGKD